MLQLERRLSTLESRQPAADPMVILLRYVSPGRVDAPSVRGEFEGVVVPRQPGEGDEQFDARVRREVQAAAPGRSVYVVHMSAIADAPTAQWTKA